MIMCRTLVCVNDFPLIPNVMGRARERSCYNAWAAASACTLGKWHVAAVLTLIKTVKLTCTIGCKHHTFCLSVCVYLSNEAKWTFDAFEFKSAPYKIRGTRHLRIKLCCDSRFKLINNCHHVISACLYTFACTYAYAGARLSNEKSMQIIIIGSCRFATSAGGEVTTKKAAKKKSDDVKWWWWRVVMHRNNP